MTILGHFKYFNPVSIKEAIDLSLEHGEKSRYIAGGSDVLVEMKTGKSSPECLISLNKIKELNYIKLEDEELRIGALTTHRQLEMSDIIRDKFTALHDAVKQVGSVQVRNVATIGGNLGSALPSADLAAPLLVLDAKLKIAKTDGERILDIKDFFVGPGKASISYTEIITEIIIPIPKKNSGSAYYKLGRRGAMEIPIVGAAVMLELGEDGNCSQARVAMVTAAPTPIRCLNAEAALVGEKPNEDTFRHAGKGALLDSKPRTSWRASSEHRKKVIPIIVERACIESLGRI